MWRKLLIYMLSNASQCSGFRQPGVFNQLPSSHMLGGAVRSQMYLILWEQSESFHIPERFGFPTTGSASMKRHFPSPYQCSSPSQESQGRKETKSPLAGPLPSPCLSTPAITEDNVLLQIWAVSSIYPLRQHRLQHASSLLWSPSQNDISSQSIWICLTTNVLA